MSPRAYNLGKRKAATDETRGRVLEAARRLLSRPEGTSSFTIDSVAREANVARMTVYYQFGSKMGLLEALYNDLGARGLVPHLATAFQTPNPMDSLLALARAFARFWASDRNVIRRLRALASLDPEVGAGIRQRDQWRLGIFRNAVARVMAEAPPSGAHADITDLVSMITSFGAFDELAEVHGQEAAERLTLELVRDVFARRGISLPAESPDGEMSSAGSGK